MNENISKKIKYFSWFLTLGIVLYHNRSLSYYNINYLSLFDKYSLYLFEKISVFCGYLGLSYFFFLSGFWLYYKSNNVTDIIKKCKKRIKTLLIPFIIWNTIVIIFCYLFNGLSFTFSKLLNYYIFSPVSIALWYLLALLLLQFLSPLIIVFKNKFKIEYLFGFIFLYFTLINFKVIDSIFTFDTWWWYSVMLNYIPVYILGCYFGMKFPKYILYKTYDNKKYFIIGLLFIIESFLLLFTINNHKIFTYVAILILIGFWLIFNCNYFNKKIPAIFSISFYIYAMNQQIILPIGRKIVIFLLNNHAVNGFEVILIKFFELIFVVCVSYLFYFFVKKLFRKKYIYLSGGR